MDKFQPKKPLDTILSHRGYSIALKDLTAEELRKHKHALTVIPYVEKEEYSFAVKPVKLYTLTDQRIYMPRHYGLKKFGKPNKDKLTTIDFPKLEALQTILKPRDHQIPIMDKVMKDLHEVYGGVISIYCGGGKCLAKNTKVMMYDGCFKNVQDIIPGDQIMGDDSTPRNVISLARGRETMYKITPETGEPYVVNESHILSLKIRDHLSIIHETNGYVVKYFDYENMKMEHKYFSYDYCTIEEAYNSALKFVNSIDTKDVIDISLKEYLDLSTSQKQCLYGYRVPVTFPYKEVELDPYVLGYWLGFGKSTQMIISNGTVSEYIESYIKVLDKDIYMYKDPQTPIIYKIQNTSPYSSNKFYNLLHKYNLINNKHIPHTYKCNDITIQLGVLAGIIDSRGVKVCNGYEFVNKNKTLTEDIVYMCRSLGFMVKSQEYIQKEEVNGGVTYRYKITISGNNLERIPLKVQHKKIPKPNNHIDSSMLLTKISLERLTEDDYYGFVIDGNHRFILGDFQVTHNTALAIMIACQLKIKTLVVCHTTSLMRQWAERINEFVPKAKIGIVQQSNTEIDGYDFVIASLSSVAQKEYPKDTFSSIGLVVWDEIHLMCTNLFSNAFTKLTTKYSVGLSATPNRKDKCDVIFQNHIGEILYTLKREKDEDIVVECVKLLIEDIPVTYDYRGKVQYTTSVTQIMYLKERTARIVDMIIDFATKGRKVLVLSEYIKHLRDIKARIAVRIKELKGIKKYMNDKKYQEMLDFTYDLYIGEMKNNERKSSEQKDVILGTYKLASVGMDIPRLNTLILASPRKEIEQSVGRILRKDKSSKVQHNPRIVDIIDNHGIFVSQSNIRKQFYKKYGYTIEHIQMLPDGHIKSRRVVSTINQDDQPKLTIKSFDLPKTKLGSVIESKMSQSKSKSQPSKSLTQPLAQFEYNDDNWEEEPNCCIIDDEDSEE